MKHRFRFDVSVRSVSPDALTLDMGNGVSATLHIPGIKSAPGSVAMWVELPADCLTVAEPAADTDLDTVLDTTTATASDRANAPAT